MNRFASIYLRGLVMTIVLVTALAILIGALTVIVLYPTYIVPLLIVVVLPLAIGAATEEMQ